LGWFVLEDHVGSIVRVFLVRSTDVALVEATSVGGSLTAIFRSASVAVAVGP
jgi:hypothetical protein